MTKRLRAAPDPPEHFVEELLTLSGKERERRAYLMGWELLRSEDFGPADALVEAELYAALLEVADPGSPVFEEARTWVSEKLRSIASGDDPSRVFNTAAQGKPRLLSRQLPVAFAWQLRLLAEVADRESLGDRKRIAQAVESVAVPPVLKPFPAASKERLTWARNTLRR